MKRFVSNERSEFQVVQKWFQATSFNLIVSIWNLQIIFPVNEIDPHEIGLRRSLEVTAICKWKRGKSLRTWQGFRKRISPRLSEECLSVWRLSQRVNKFKNFHSETQANWSCAFPVCLLFLFSLSAIFCRSNPSYVIPLAFYLQVASCLVDNCHKQSGFDCAVCLERSPERWPSSSELLLLPICSDWATYQSVY